MGILVMLFFLGMPVGFSMLFVGIIGFCYLVSPTAGLSLLGSDLFAQFSSYSYTAFPMFIFAGSLAFIAGMGNRIFDGSHALFGRLPGSLAITSTVACAGFAAICGSSTATAAAIGRVTLPVMRRYGYDDRLATASVAAAGALGPLIPPSTIFILYGILSQQSIGRLFIAGILPGILLTFLLASTVVILCLLNPALAPPGPRTTTRQKISGITGLSEAFILFASVICGLSFGWFTPTQGGAALAALILLIGLTRRQISWQGFIGAVKDSVRLTCMIMVIIGGGVIFGRFLAVSNIPFFLADWLAVAPLPPIVIMAIIISVYLLIGCFMDMLSAVVLTLPVILPAVIALGFDPIWFGVIIVLVGETAVITPPVGINVYVIHAVAKDVPIGTIFSGVWPFVGAQVLCIALLMIFPQIATFLPDLIKY
ncbi:TRAP transporter large permease [Chloroflexota bacterium]